MISSELKYFLITTGSAPAYNKPTFNSICVTEGIKGEICSILSKNNNWLNLRFEDGYVAWVNGFYGINISRKKFFPYKIIYPFYKGFFRSDLPFGSKLEYKVDGAIKIESNLTFDSLPLILKSLINVPYKWGGKTSLGFDCSGLIQSVLKCIGISIPRDSMEQYNYFKNDKISMDDAKIGDLHFFGKKNKVSHVGFSIGKRGIIHSQGFVKQESLDKDEHNFNKSLLDIYLSTHSIRRKFPL